MIKEYYKHPRLFLKDRLQEKITVSLSSEQAHYLKNVLRKTEGDFIRVFNGQDGEWLCRISALEKKSGNASLDIRLRQQGTAGRAVHLYFAPIRKQRMDVLIEKAVELGVREFHPVITHRTENRNLNMKRLEAQIFEAAEQCERLVIPSLHTPVTLGQVLGMKRVFPLFAALEREAATPLSSIDLPQEVGFLIGPEGGFDDEEIGHIKDADITAITLGEAVLRAETASIVCLTHAMLQQHRG